MLSVPSSGIELIVKGTKLDVTWQSHREPPQRRKRYPLKHIHVEKSSVEEHDDNDDKEVETEEDERKEFGIPRRPTKEVFRLNTATFAAKDVQSDRLRVIRESHQVQDLRRLLISHLGAAFPNQQPHAANRRNGHHLTAIGVDPDSIYRHFFQDHYDAIRHAVEDEDSRQRVHHDYKDSDDDTE